MTELISQGSLDGFCGLYATAHLIAVLSATDYEASTNKAFFQLLRSLERRRRLTAKRIASTNPNELGFTARFIADAVNETPTRSRQGIAAVSFENATFKHSAYFKNAPLAFENGCGFVIQVDEGNHWVATSEKSSAGRYICFDPSAEREHAEFGKIFWNEGLMVGPTRVIEEL